MIHRVALHNVEIEVEVSASAEGARLALPAAA
jgi:hypothetical protein